MSRKPTRATTKRGRKDGSEGDEVCPPKKQKLTEEYDSGEERQTKPEPKTEPKPKLNTSSSSEFYVVAVLDQISPGNTSAEVHTFPDWNSAVEFKDERLTAKAVWPSYSNIDPITKEHIFSGDMTDGTYQLKIKKVSLGQDVNMCLLK